jgi:hypothetical protein
MPTSIIHASNGTIDDLRMRVAQFGKDSTKILNKILRSTSVQYKNFVIKNYLRNQMLHVVSGRTVNSMAAFKEKGSKSKFVIRNRVQTNGKGYVGLASIYEHPGGVDIRPKNAKALAFLVNGEIHFFRGTLHVESRPFMSSSERAFPWDSVIYKSANKIITKEIKKRNL